MNSVHNLICKLEYIPIAQVISFVSNSASEATLTYSGNAQELPIAKSSARYSCELERSEAGIIYSVSVSARLKENVTDLSRGIYLVTVDDGTTYILGTQDYPVRYNSAESLTEKSFDFAYRSLAKPFKRKV